MKIVSNTGPIIGLAKINRLSILKDLAGEILIPPMVHRELLAKTGNEAILIDEALNSFIHISPVPPLDPSVKTIIADLDAGEGHAIGLASVFSGDVLLLLDDRAGRTAAERLNIPTTGLVGLLLLAKERGIVASVSELISELREQGYWLSDRVVVIARQLACE